MIVDCDSCVVRGDACQDCVISVLLGAPPSGVDTDGPERRALDALAQAGMVPRLRFVPMTSVISESRSDRGTPLIVDLSGSHDEQSQERAS